MAKTKTKQKTRTDSGSPPGEPAGSTVPGLDPLAAEKAKQERQKAADEASKKGVQTPAGPSPPIQVAPPKPTGPIPVGKGSGKAYEYIDDKGVKKYYTGRGKPHSKVSAYLGGDLTAVRVVDWDEAAGKPKAAPTGLGPDGLPLPDTEEYKKRMEFAETFCEKHLLMLSSLYEKKYNNPMAPEEISYGVFMCKWVIFKYADHVQNQPEIMAGAFLVQNHLQHAKYISTISNQPVDEETWFREQGLEPPKRKRKRLSDAIGDMGKIKFDSTELEGALEADQKAFAEEKP
jgi:hypothetical protein